MTPPTITETAFANMLIHVALEFVGLTETKPNAQWDNPKTKGPDPEINARLIGLMRPAPWEPGWAHCAAFAEGMVVEALLRCGATAVMTRKFSAVHTPHVMSNYRAFKKLGLISPTPSMGALWLAQHGLTDMGHEGIITVPVVSAGRMGTIESNTSAGPAQTAMGDREGDWITEKERAHSTNGKLRTRGFVSVASILKLIE
jgi:hypothetical protein